MIACVPVASPTHGTTHMIYEYRPYLRALRRRWALTQTELAFLIGANSSAVISRIEDDKRLPKLAAAVACELIFCVPLSDIFATHRSEIERGLIERAYVLYDELQGHPASSTKLKLDFLEGILARLDQKAAPAKPWSA